MSRAGCRAGEPGPARSPGGPDRGPRRQPPYRAGARALGAGGALHARSPCVFTRLWRYTEHYTVGPKCPDAVRPGAAQTRGASQGWSQGAAGVRRAQRAGARCRRGPGGEAAPLPLPGTHRGRRAGLGAVEVRGRLALAVAARVGFASRLGSAPLLPPDAGPTANLAHGGHRLSESRPLRGAPRADPRGSRSRPSPAGAPRSAGGPGPRRAPPARVRPLVPRLCPVREHAARLARVSTLLRNARCGVPLAGVAVAPDGGGAEPARAGHQRCGCARGLPRARPAHTVLQLPRSCARPAHPAGIGRRRGRTERSPRARARQWRRPLGLIDAPPSANGDGRRPARAAPASAYKSRRAGPGLHSAERCARSRWRRGLSLPRGQHESLQPGAVRAEERRVGARPGRLPQQDPGRRPHEPALQHERLLLQAQGAGAQHPAGQEGQQDGNPAARHRLHPGPAARAGLAARRGRPAPPAAAADHAQHGHQHPVPAGVRVPAERQQGALWLSGRCPWLWYFFYFFSLHNNRTPTNARDLGRRSGHVEWTFCKREKKFFLKNF